MLFFSETQLIWLHINFYGFFLIPLIIIFNFFLIYFNFNYNTITKQTIIFSIYISISYFIYYFYFIFNLCRLKYNNMVSSNELRFDWHNKQSIYLFNTNWLYGLFFSIIVILFFFILYNNINKTDWQEVIIILINFMLINCIYNIKNIIIFIIIFEIFSLFIYLFLIQNKYNNNWNNTQYYFISFLVSIIFILWILSLIYILGNINFEFLKLNNLYNINNFYLKSYILGISIIVLSIFIKLGTIPFNSWLYNIYKKFNNITLFYFLSIYKMSLLIILSFFMLLNTYLYGVNHNIWFIYITIAIGTTFIGSLLLNNQTNIKQFIISNSFIHLGTILTWFSLNIFNKTNFDHISFNTWLLYIFFYILIILLLFFIIFEINKNIENNYMKINLFLYKTQNIWLIIILIWVLSAFPPFILFFLKFYILYYLLKSGLFFFGLLFFIINSTLIIWGYIRIFNYILINYKW